MLPLLPQVHPLLLRWDPAAPAFPNDAEWDRIVDEARGHRLTPLLFRRVHEAGWSQRIPAPSFLQLKQRARAETGRSMVLAHELSGLLRALHQADIPCMSLRGPGLAQDLYGDASLRPADDLDLLIRRCDRDRIVGLLSGRGYREHAHRPGFAAAFSYSLVYLKEGPIQLAVEPHWTLAYPPDHDRLDMDAVWNRSALARESLRELASDDLVLHLCLHLMHRWDHGPLLWLCDLDRLIRREHPAIHWDRLLQTARDSGQSDLIEAALDLVHRTCGTPLPDRWLVDLHHDAARGRTRRSPLATSSLAGREEFALWLALPDLSSKLRYAAGLLLPSPAFMRERYGLTHPIGLACAYARRVLALGRDAVKSLARHAAPPLDSFPDRR